MSSTDEIPVGAVLSDKDIKDMVKKIPNFITVDKKKIELDDKEGGNLRPSGIDLQVGRVSTHKTEKTKDGQTLILPPGGVAHIESRERFNMPENIMGFLTPRNKYSERGLLMLNAGHVDPGWGDGYLTAEVINLSEEGFSLTVGYDRPFSIIFQYMHSSTTIRKPAEDDENRRGEARERLKNWPETLYSPYRDRIIKELDNKYATRGETMGRSLLWLTIVVLVVGALGALAGGVYLGIWLWEHIGPLPPLIK